MPAVSMRQHHAGHGIARAYAGVPCVTASASWLRNFPTADTKPSPQRPPLISP